MSETAGGLSQSSDDPQATLENTLDTGWTRALNRGTKPGAADVRNHLEIVHSTNAGFTEACAAACRDAQGRNSYDWLAEAIQDHSSDHILDLACGSGVLLEQLATRYPAARLTGADMSGDELALAARRIDPNRVSLHCAMAQELDFLADATVDAVLCHWALTLMQPIKPVLHEIGRVLSPGGIFAAIVDGPMNSAPGYTAINDLIFDHVSRAYPSYGSIDLGDPRVRDSRQLVELLGTQFVGSSVSAEVNVVSMTGAPEFLAQEASRFFYSVFVLNEAERAAMLEDLTAYFAAQGPTPAFHMPINRVIVAT